MELLVVLMMIFFGVLGQAKPTKPPRRLEVDKKPETLEIFWPLLLVNSLHLFLI